MEVDGLEPTLNETLATMPFSELKKATKDFLNLGKEEPLD